MSKFKVEDGAITLPASTGVKEFNQLKCYSKSDHAHQRKSHQVQKEFELQIVSHELLILLAIILNKIDNLMQDEHLTKHQAQEMQEMQQELMHMSRLSKNLLLLSKIENNRYKTLNHINLCDKIELTANPT